MLKGHHFEDLELSREFNYWFFANKFGYSSEQVDQLPYDRMIYFLELEKEFMKMQADKNKK